MRSRIPSWVAVAAAAVLVMAACSGDRDDGDAAVAQEPTEEPTEQATEEPTPASTEEAAPTEPPEPEQAAFGTAPWPCGPGDASGATDQGVTDDAIRIGVGDDRGFSGTPGLNREQTDALLAFIEVCNSLGGINGRTIEPVLYDAAIFQAGNVILEACDEVFMLVGNGFAFDSAAEQARVECELAAVPAFTASADASHGPFQVTAVPNPSDQQTMSMASIIANVVAPDLGIDIANSGALVASFLAGAETYEKVEASWPDAYGYDFGTRLEYNVGGEDDWTPFALAFRDAGVEHVFYPGACLPSYQAMRQAGAVNGLTDVIWTAESNMYDFPCRDANTDGAMDGTYIRMDFVPFEEADANPATAEFLEIIEGAGATRHLLGLRSVSSFLLWATAASECGSELTRDCVMENIAAVDEWTGHGLHVPTNPSSNEVPECGMVLKLEGMEFVRVFPEEPATFACGEDFGEEWRLTIDTPAVDAAQLGPDRVSTKYTG